MSNRALYTVAKGQDKSGVVKTTDASGGGLNSNIVQVIVDNGVALNKTEVVVAVALALQKIMEDTFPEA